VPDSAPDAVSRLSLHDALPIYAGHVAHPLAGQGERGGVTLLAELCGADPLVVDEAAHDRAVALVSHAPHAVSTAAGSVPAAGHRDRKSTRLNSSHVKISYAVFC